MRLLGLALANLRRDLAGACLLALAVAAGSGAFTVFVGLGRGTAAALHRLFPASERTVLAVPPRLRLGGLLGSKLDDATVARLAALPEVERGEREMLLGVPASSLYRGAFFGTPLDMGIEVAALGVESSLVARDLPRGEAFGWDGRGPVPACVSDRLLALYDTTFAPARGLPHLTASAVLGFTFPLTLGRSLVGAPRGPVEELSARVVCVSPRALLAGLTLPLEVVRRWNARAGLDASEYSAVVLTARSEESVPAVEAAVRRLGFEVDDSERKSAALAGRAAALIVAALSALSLLVTVLAALGIGQALAASVRSRRRELAVLRALGATPGDAAALVLWEAAAVGLLGGFGGLGAAFALARTGDWALARWLPAFPGRPETLVALSPALAASGVLLALAAALLGAWAPARAAARLDPARALQA